MQSGTVPKLLSYRLLALVQAAELFYGAAGRPHDYLQETLLRLVGVGFLGAATQNWVLKVGNPLFEVATSEESDFVMFSELSVICKKVDV